MDYFGARYFSGAQGRFTSPDKPLLDQHIEDPQSWNLYAYARNNPLIYTDPTGEAIELLGDEEARKKALELLQRGVGNKDAASRLYINSVTDGDTTRYFVGIQGNADEFQKLGQFSKDLGNLVADPNVVEFGVTSRDLSDYGGAATYKPGEDNNQNVRVLVNPDQMSIADGRLSPNTVLGALRWGGQDLPRADRWTVRPMTPEIAAWHEFGHASGYMARGWLSRRLFGLPNQPAVEWENRMRSQLYGQFGTNNAPRKRHYWDGP